MHKAKKSLGQNFLKSQQALRKIIEVGEISPNDVILEIGPGKGALTQLLLEKSNCVVAIEKDRNLVEFLKEKFANEIVNGKLILKEGDILEFDQNNISQGLKYKIIANIPYNITGAILKKFLTNIIQPTMMILMIQHEVAKRIIGRRTNPTLLKLRGARESILSISVKAHGTPKIEMKVPARYFSPAPKVDSAIISIKNISRDFFTKNKIDENKFWEIIHAGFAHKRKKLISNLKNHIGPSYVIHEKIFGNKRAEELTLSDWIFLAKNT